MTSFSDLGLAPSILKALDAEGHDTPTPIQGQAIPHVMQGRDLLGIAQTGTGKTAAFALPILHRLAAERRRPAPKTCRALILSPTRELASQIAERVRAYGRNLGLSTAVVFGGVPHSPQRRAIASGLDVLVATPGRLIDHLQARDLVLGQTEILVLDEADQMLDLGFVRAIRTLVAQLPKERQSLFFSATMPKTIAGLAAELLTDPVEVAVTPVATTAERVEQRVIYVDAGAKRDLLADMFADRALDRVLVFTRTKHGADRVASHLVGRGIGAAAIHGNKSQSQRERALADFKNGRARALVATDIAARGIDVREVSHVVNFELPNVPESYVHRIGRTARAGADGIAISFCDPDERAYLRDIEKLTRQQIPATDPSGEPIPEAVRNAPVRRPKGPPGRTAGNGSGRPQHQGRPQQRPFQQQRPNGHQPQRAGRPQGGGERRPGPDQALGEMAFMRTDRPRRPRRQGGGGFQARPRG